MDRNDDTHCPRCGAAAGGGVDACRALFHDLLGREYDDFRYARRHRTLVDAYALQHPEEYMISGKSYAAHLTGACAAVEHEDAERVNRAVQSWLSTNPEIGARPALPVERGEVTVADAFLAADPDEHALVMDRWIRSIWEAWCDHHELARELISRAASG